MSNAHESEKYPEEAFAGYFDSRFVPNAARNRVWRHLVAYLSRWWDADAAVADIGAGYCSFINEVRARRRVAVDVHPNLEHYAHPGVECVRESVTSLTRRLDAGAFDVAFASNLLEHLTRREIWLALSELRAILRPQGRLILLQPNFRLRANEYFDDYTHVTPLSDRSLPDVLSAAGYSIVQLESRFLPFSMRSRASALSMLTPLYLRLPWRPAAGQMLVVAERPPGDPDGANERPRA